MLLSVIVVIFILDFLYTTLVAIGTAWFYVSRYLAARTPTQLGIDDVKTLRSMRDELLMLVMLDESGLYRMPEKNLEHIRALVETHDNQKELPQ